MKKKVFAALAIRLAVIALIVPQYSSNLFAPFLTQASFTNDIWSEWINSGGDVRAFPYGLAMVIMYIPSLLIFKISQFLSVGSSLVFEISIAFQLLAAEALLWRVIHKTKAMKESLNIFLFSPLFIWVSYVLGLNDLFPSGVLFLAASFLLVRKYKIAGVFIGIAIGMKFSLALVLPFLILFAWDNPRFKEKIWSTILFSSSVGAVMYFPGVYSPGFREMVFNNKESMKALEYTLTFSNNDLLILPLIYVLLMYWLWKAGRISVEVLIAFFGIALFLISAFSPTSLGWMLWGLPLMFMILAKERKSRLQLLLIQSLFLLFSASNGVEIQTRFGLLELEATNHAIRDVIFTLGLALVAIFSYSSLKIAILHGDRYKIAEAPLTVSIAGDSGTGKDTLAHALIQMFIPNTGTVLNGDDYHKYERGDISWKKLTHLNPDANYLDLWERDYKLAHKRMYFERREYDHDSGKFSQLKPRLRRDLVISQGIHGLYPGLSARSDLRIFMSMDEALRIKLKMARDTSERGRSHQEVSDDIYRRQKDYDNFVAFQVESSDVHYHLHEVLGEIHLKVTIGRTHLVDQLISTLESYSRNQIKESANGNSKVFEINPRALNGENLSIVLKSLITDYDQLFLEEPKLMEGSVRIMSLISIFLMARIREERLA